MIPGRRRLRIVFFGSSSFAETILRALHPAHEVAAVVTRPDRPAGRGARLRPTRIRRVAEEYGLPVFAPPGFRRPGRVERVAAHAPDCLAVADYGRILPPALLAVAPLGAINVHASLLPALRGAAPAFWAVARGYRRTGVTTMLMDEGLDTGPILHQREVAVAPDETGGGLLSRLAPLGAGLLLETLDGLASGTVTPRRQDDREATSAPPIRKADAALDWERSGAELERRVRAFAPAQAAFTGFPGRDGPALLRIHTATFLPASTPGSSPGEFRRTGTRRAPELEITCGSGVLLPREVQTSGGRPMSIADFLRGDRLLNPPAGAARPRFLAAAEAAALLGPEKPRRRAPPPGGRSRLDAPPTEPPADSTRAATNDPASGISGESSAGPVDRLRSAG